MGSQILLNIPGTAVFKVGRMKQWVGVGPWNFPYCAAGPLRVSTTVLRHSPARSGVPYARRNPSPSWTQELSARLLMHDCSTWQLNSIVGPP